MSTLTNMLRPAAEPPLLEEAVAEQTSPSLTEARSWSPARFGEEQIRLLVRQIFFPGSAKPVRLVVFSAVDESAYVAEICMDAAKTLAGQVSGSVCVIEANSQNPELERVFGAGLEPACPEREGFGFLRSSSQHVTRGLWLAPRHLLTGHTDEGSAPAWLERRLSDFRLEFDYTLLHAPAVTTSSEAVLLSRMSDGVVLVLEANATRRAAALKAREMLQTANARLLGAVLSERTFPIPEDLYRRL